MSPRTLLLPTIMLPFSGCSAAPPVDPCAAIKQRYTDFHSKIAPKLREAAAEMRPKAALAEQEAYPTLAQGADAQKLMGEVEQEQRRYEIGMRECGGEVAR